MSDASKNGGIELKNLAAEVKARMFPASGQRDGAMFTPGVCASNVLRLGANVADTETVTIGADVYEIETVATAIGGGVVAAGGQLNNLSDPVLVTIAAHGLVAGDPVACQAEIMQVLRVVDVNNVVLTRARFGTAVATHADGQTINKGNGITAGRIPVGFIATFTPAVAGPAIAAAINNAAAANGERLASKASTIYPTHKATSLLAGAEVLLETRTAAALVTACAETLAGANNVWSAAAMAGGVAMAAKKTSWVSRVPTATEVALGQMEFVFPFTPTIVDVFVKTTATGVTVLWNGAAVITGGRVTVDNVGATDWSVNETVQVTVSE
jgi:hypothetical protein